MGVVKKVEVRYTEAPRRAQSYTENNLLFLQGGTGCQDPRQECIDPERRKMPLRMTEMMTEIEMRALGWTEWDHSDSYEQRSESQRRGDP